MGGMELAGITDMASSQEHTIHTQRVTMMKCSIT